MAPEPSRLPTASMLAEARRIPEGTARGLLAFVRDEHTHFFLITALVGAGAGFAALAVRWLTALITGIAFGEWTGNVPLGVRQSPWFLRLLAPAIGGVLAGLLVQRAARRAGSAGISGIMEAVTLRHGFLSLRRTMWVALGSVTALATGGSVGREGAIVQVSSAFASRLGRWFSLPEMRVRVLVAAAAGAGIAAAYNTPIAGTLFVLEVVAGTFATDLIGPTVIAAVIGTFVGRIYLWHGPIYRVPHFELRTPQELLAYVGLGIATGLFAAVFLWLLRFGEAAFKRVSWPRWARTGLGGLAVGLIALRLPEVCGNGYETLVDILNEERGLGLALLLVLLVSKMMATSASVGSGAPGGIFTPTLFAGAALGGAAGMLVHFAFPNSTDTHGSYALVGMGALLAATSHAPMTATVLIAELTGDYAVVPPLLLSCGIASMLTYRMDSVYTRELRKRGITWEGNLEQRIVNSMKARDIMRTDVPLLRADSPFAEVVRQFTSTRTPCLYLGDVDHNLVGVIELHAVKEILAAEDLSNLLIAQDLAEPAKSVTADTSLAAVNEKLWFIDTGEVAVVENASTPRFLGVVTRRDLLGFLDREILRRNLLMAEVRWRDGLEKGIEYLELPEGYRLENLPVPPDLVGKTLQEAALRSKYGLNVIAVTAVDRDGNERRHPPRPDYRLQANDRLVVVASSEDVEAFEKRRSGT